jgi:hypothetical protein
MASPTTMTDRTLPLVRSVIDDAVPTAQRLAGPPDGVDGLRDQIAVLGVFVREHQLSGGSNLAGLIAVHTLHLLGPFPALIVEVEAKGSDAFRRDRRLLE